MDNINIIHKKIRYDCEQVTIEYCLCNNNTPPSSGNYMFTKKSWEKAGGYPEGNWLDTWGFGINQLISGAKMYTLPDTYYFHRRGHESYTIRELKKNNISLTALQILIPHLQLLSKRSEDYIMSKGRYDWLEKLNKHPLTLAKKQRNFDKKQIEIFKNNIKIYFPKLYNYYLKIKFNKKNKK